MADINTRLIRAAKTGSEVEIKALLQEPGCDALFKNRSRTTALMYAAWFGHEKLVRLLLPVSDALGKEKNGLTTLMQSALRGHQACVRLLLPVSDALTKNKNGLTASDLARDNGHESLAHFIEAYTLSLSELSAIGEAACPGSSRGRAALRV